jgi:hypothetical protein
MGMYPQNMMGMNPNNINLNGDASQSSNPQQAWNDMQMQGFHPGMFQQNFQNQNGPNQEENN